MIGLSGSIQVFAARVLNSIPEGLLIAIFAWLILRLVGRQNSGTRFAVWFVALLAIAFIPFVPAPHIGGSVSRAVHAELTLPGLWAVAVCVVWGMISLFAIATLAFGLLRLRSLRRNAEPVLSAELDPALQSTLEECQAIRPVELRVSAEVRVPTAIGFFKPVILLPEWVLESLSTDELRTVVLHEFAHLRRRDDWTNLAQKLVRALFFFHPAVLWVEKRLSLEREMACDDAVLAETRNPHAYARCLVSLAEKSFVRRSVALAQAAISRAQETSLRVAQILDTDRPRATRVFKPVLAAIAGVAAVAFVAVPNVPRLIAFRDSTPGGSQGRANFAQLAPVEHYPQLPKSMIIPAMARIERPQAKPLKLEAAKIHAVREAAQPNVVLTKHVSSPRKPLVVQAGLREPQEQFLVVTQTTDYYAHGSEIVGISVWRVTLVKASMKPSKQVERPNQT